MKKLRRIAVGAAALAALFIANTAYAIPMSGSFTLTDDGVPNSSETVLGTGNFTTTSVVTADDISILGTLYDTVTLSAFSVIGAGVVGSEVPSLTLGGTVVTPYPSAMEDTLVAVLNDAHTSILGFFGTIGDTSAPNAQLFFDFYATGTVAGQAYFESNTGASGGAVSGLQVVPEPTAIALFGIGLLGFGLARRRKV